MRNDQPQHGPGPQVLAVVFDVYGTLLEISSVKSAVASLSDKATEIVATWRSKMLEYTWLRSLMDQYCPFDEIVKDSLDFALDLYLVEATAKQRKELVESWLETPPYAEVKRALTDLSGKLELGVLSNGTKEMLDLGLGTADLVDYFSEILSVDEVGIYKPSPRTYSLACREFALPPEQILFVSSNPWDVAGAKAFGFKVAWINRTSQPTERLGFPSDFIFTDLTGLAEVLSN